MMNYWDKKFNEFTNNFELETDLRLEGLSYSLIIDDERFEIFNWVGNTDVTSQKNKIYADCSIVEFDFQSPSMKKSIKRIGTFNYDVNDLCFKLNGITYNILTISNLKVIGTILENPELLKGNQ